MCGVHIAANTTDISGNIFVHLKLKYVAMATLRLNSCENKRYHILMVFVKCTHVAKLRSAYHCKTIELLAGLPIS